MRFGIGLPGPFWVSVSSGRRRRKAAPKRSTVRAMPRVPRTTPRVPQIDLEQQALRDAEAAHARAVKAAAATVARARIALMTSEQLAEALKSQG